MDIHKRAWLPILFTMTMAPIQGLNADWQWINPKPQGNILADVTWGNGEFVAIGNAGTVMTSPDGNVWVERDSNTHQWFQEVIWTGSQYLAVGNHGTIAVSPDGEAWARVGQSLTTNYLYGVTQGADRLLAVGTNSTIVHSSDGGKSWVRETLPDTMPRVWLNDVLWDGQRYIAVGEKGNIFRGTPGSWTALTAPVSFQTNSGSLPSLEGIATNGAIHVIVAEGPRVLRSADGGASWTSHVAGASQLNSVIWDGDNFVAVGKAGAVYTSPDGLAWTMNPSTPTVRGELESVAASTGGTYVAVGEGGLLWQSEDGSQWIARSEGERVRLEAVAYHDGEIIAVGADGTILRSVNGGAVERVEHEGGSGTLHDVIRADNQYTAVGASGTVLTSSDGTNWQAQPGVTSNLLAVAWGNGGYVAVGEGRAAYGNGAWSTVTTPGGVTLRDVTYTGTQFIAVGDAGSVATSADGSAWTPRTSGTANALQGIASSGTRLVAVGASGTILTSGDGLQWSAVDPVTDNDLHAVRWTGSHFYAAGSNGTILVSSDGTSWEFQQATGNVLRGVGGEASTVIVVGDSGTILSSVCPCATDDTATTTRNTPVTIHVLANDLGTGLSVQAVSKTSAGGTVSHDGQVVDYVPPIDFVGNDSFEYTVVGQGGGNSIGTVMVQVLADTSSNGGSNDDSNGGSNDGSDVGSTGSSGGGGGGLGGLALLGLVLVALHRRLG